MKLSLTTAITNGFTFVFYVMQLIIKALIQRFSTEEVFAITTIYVAIICNLNPLANIAAIVIRQDDIRNFGIKEFQKIVSRLNIRKQ